MPTSSAGVVRFVLKNWPIVLKTATELSTFVKDHPGLPAWAQQRVADAQRRITAAAGRRGDAAQIRGMLDVVRDTAADLAAHDPGRAPLDTAAWLTRADRIELGVRIAEKQARPDQRATLARLRVDTDALLATVLDALSDVRALPGT